MERMRRREYRRMRRGEGRRSWMKERKSKSRKNGGGRGEWNEDEEKREWKGLEWMRRPR